MRRQSIGGTVSKELLPTPQTPVLSSKFSSRSIKQILVTLKEGVEPDSEIGGLPDLTSLKELS